MKKYLLLFVCSIFLVINSCTDSDVNIETKTPVTVQQIGKGNLVGNYVPQQNMVITNSTQWNTLLNTLDSVNNTSGSFTETNIDFNQFMVIAVFDEVFPNGGHSIDIITVDDNPQNIVVDLERLLTGNLTTVVTQPYHIVKIPKSTKPVLFQ
ncbi:protease complex subunit PrcB family protein [Chryseobacterium chendengshani]|uniref:protease complex subunit PrcB family protein n=1 Tax=Chryseobacterium sp. LJ668 TaxID=2864040 RepID=UPI001C691A9F|nr:protease complex subunit PrcB family protein [Chryseobacterium sp. LJ668]MBW8523949.1 protease complex subunit PrcB family protein [Chryseobacterium sp. LJ668]QYK16889.1 protease complex subunit PrcB family protein [Chryseobacterium sp. LJ668]